MKHTKHDLHRSAQRLAGAALLLLPLGISSAAQCGEDLYIRPPAYYDNFGSSVAVDGDWAVVGLLRFDTPGGAGDVGAADVFRRANGDWVFHQRLGSPNVSVQDYLGASVAISGSTLVVGASGHNVGNPVVYDQGCAIVYQLQGDQWVETDYLLASDGDSYDYFGGAVAIDGDVIAIGASYDEDTGGTEAGSVYVFERVGGIWVEGQKLQPTGVGPKWHFGGSVDVDGSSIIAGARGDSGAADIGHAAVFVKYGVNWLQQALWTDPVPGAQQYFGVDVAIDGDMAVVGENHGHAPVTGYRVGLAHIYYRTGATWSAGPILEPALSASASWYHFGNSVDIVNDTTIAVSAIGDDAFATDAGSVRVFEETAGVWTEVAHLGQCQASSSDKLGSCLAASADTIFVGAHEDDDIGVNAGKVLVVSDLGGTWTPTEELWKGSAISVAAGGSTAIELDFGVANAGRMFFVGGSMSGRSPGLDVNGFHVPLNYDGYTDLTVFTPNAPPLLNSLGFTDGNGRATCTFSLPAGTDPIYAGLTLTHCAILIVPFDYVTRADNLLTID